MAVPPDDYALYRPTDMSAPQPRLFLVSKPPAAELDDTALAQLAKDGDAAAHTAIWDRYAAMVRRVLRRSLGPQHDVEDQVQEVFLRFFRNRRLLRDPAALRGFLFGIALRVAASELRSRRVRGWLRLTPTGMLDDQPVAPADTDTREAVVRLYGVLDRLDPSSRILFVLRFIDGLELTEVAATLDVSLATVKRRLVRVTTRVTAMVQGEPVLLEYLGKNRSFIDKGGSHDPKSS